MESNYAPFTTGFHLPRLPLNSSAGLNEAPTKNCSAFSGNHQPSMPSQEATQSFIPSGPCNSQNRMACFPPTGEAQYYLPKGIVGYGSVSDQDRSAATTSYSLNTMQPNGFSTNGSDNSVMSRTYGGMVSSGSDYGKFSLNEFRSTAVPRESCLSRSGPVAGSSMIDKEVVDDAIREGKNVYVRGLPPSTTDASLYNLVKHIGNIVSTKAILEQTCKRLVSGSTVMEKGLCKGYGFIMFSDVFSASQAIMYLKTIGYDSSLAKESFSTKLRTLQDQLSTNLYFSNLPLDMTELLLDNLILCILNSPNVRVLSSRVLRYPDGTSKGVGFARLNCRAAAESVIMKLNGVSMRGSIAPVQIRFADTTEQKMLKSGMAKSDLNKAIMEELENGCRFAGVTSSAPALLYSGLRFLDEQDQKQLIFNHHQVSTAPSVASEDSDICNSSAGSTALSLSNYSTLRTGANPFSKPFTPGSYSSEGSLKTCFSKLMKQGP